MAETLSKTITLPKDDLRPSGIESVGAIPWGSHFCQFCQTKEDLLESLVPYFKEGLANNEFCVWVTCEFLTEDEARLALKKEIPDFADFEKKGQIEIFPYTEWYLKGGKFEMDRVLKSWLQKYEHGLNLGFCGLRVSGNPFWLESKQDWQDFSEYESNISGAIAGKNILVLCTYSLDKCGANEIIDVVNNHEFALIKRDGRLETIESAAHKKTQESLRETQEQYRNLFNKMDEGFCVIEMIFDPTDKPVDYRFLEINAAFEKQTGLHNAKGKLMRKLAPGHEKHWFEIYGKIAMTGEPARFINEAKALNRWYDVYAYRIGAPEERRVAIIFNDISAYKRAEEALRESEQRHRNLFDSMTEGFALSEIVLNADGKLCDYRFIEINPAFEKFIGLKRSDIVGKLRSQIPVVLNPSSFAAYAKAALTREPQFFENYNKTLNKYYTVRVYSPAPKQFATIFTDITEQKKADETLRESEERFKALFWGLPLSTVVFQKIGDDFVINDYNEASQSFTGGKMQEFVGRKAGDLYGTRPDILEKFALVLKEKTPRKMQTTYRKTSTGEEIFLDLALAYVPPDKIIMHSVDVTKSKKAEDALRENELRYRTVADNTFDWEFWIAPDGKFIYCSPSCERIIQRKNQEFLADPGLRKKLIHPDDRAEFEKHLKEAEKKQESGNGQWRYLLEDGTWRWIEHVCQPVYGDNGEFLGTRGSNRDITERVETQSELKESQKRLHSIVNGSSIPQFVIDKNHKILYWNETLAKISGIKAEDVVGTDKQWSAFYNKRRPCLADLLVDLAYEKIPDLYRTKFSKSKLIGGAYEAEDFFPNMGKNGKWLYFTAVTIKDSGGKTIGALETLEDITERKLAEKKLSLANNILKALSDASKALVNAGSEKSYLEKICRIITDDDRYTQSWIGIAENNAQKSVKPIAGSGFEDGYLETLDITWADTERGRGPIGAAIRTGQPSKCSNMLTDPASKPWRKEALARGYASSLALPLLSNGGVLGAIMIYSPQPEAFTAEEVKLLGDLAEDVANGISHLRLEAAKKEAEAAFKISELKYRRLFESAKDGILILDYETGMIVDVNPFLVNWLGYSFDNLLKKHIWDIGLFRDILSSRDAFLELQKKEFIRYENLPLETKDGKKMLVEFVSNVYLVDRKKVIQCNIRDITERKKAQEKLRESEERFRALAENVPDLIVRCDKTLRIIYANPAALRRTGLSEKNMVGRTAGEYGMPPQDAAKWETAARQVLDSGEPQRIEYANQWQEKTLIFDVQMMPERDSDGQVQAVVAFAHDITNRKKYEETLRESRERLDLALASSRMATFDWDIVKNKRVWSYGIHQLLGTKPETFIGDAEEFSRIIHPDDRNFMQESLDKAIKTGVYETEYRVVWPDGSIRHIAARGKVHYDKAGQAVQMTGVCWDITGRKKAEEALRETKDYLESLFDSANAPIIVWDTGFKITRFNAAFERMAGYSAKEVIGKDLALLFPPDSRKESLNKINRTLAGERWHIVEIPIQRKDGNIRIALWNSANIYDKTGKILIATIAQGQDITERKDAEEKIEHLASFPQINPNPVIELDMEGKVNFCNESAQKVAGADAKPLIPRDLTAIIAALKTSDSPLSYREIVVGDQIFGETIHLLKNLNLIRIYAFDVTQRKLAEQRLNKLNRTLQALSSTNQAFIGATDEKSYLQKICDIIVNVCGYTMTWIGYVNNDEEKSVEPIVSAGFENGYLETLNISWADTERGQGPTGRAIRTGKPCSCSNMLTDPAFEPWRKEALARGYASSLSLPLSHGDAVLGVITLYSPQSGAFSGDEIELLQELADDVASGIFSLRAAAAKQQAEEELRKTNQRLAIISYTANRLLTSENPRLIIEELCQRVMKFIDCQVFFNYLIDNKTNRLHLNASSGVRKDNLKSVEWLNLGESICGCVARDGSQIVVDHVQESPDPRVKLVKSYGIMAYACYPLLKQEEVLGTLSFGTNDRDSFTKEDLTLMRAVTDQVAIAMNRIRSEEALRESEEKFRQIADTMPNLVWTARPNGNVEYVNLTFRDYTGINNVNGVIWNAIPLSSNDRRLMEMTRKRAANLGQPYQLEQRIRRSDGNWRWHLTRCIPIIDNGAILKWYGTSTDIDDIKVAVEKLREADEEKSRFISTMSHELRNPLTPIVAGAELVKSYLDMQTQDVAQDSPVEKIIRESVSIIDQQAKNMARLLDDMLDISRISRGKIQLKKQPVSLGNNLASAIRTVSPLMKTQNHSFSATLPDQSLNVLADPVRLQQIFINLLNNAVKYTPPGGQIWLTTSQIGNFAQITVRDTGLGIEPEKIKSIFASYGNSRGVTPFVSTQGELGIGLKLTKELVSLHGGTITASSPGKNAGCEFTVRLRVLPPGESPETNDTPDGKTSIKPTNGLRALVVDDNTGAADMTGKTLNFFGLDVKVCYDARAALELAGAYQPDIMLIDIEMPGMNGYELARALRKMEGRTLQPLKLVAVTGYGQKEDKELALNAGFDLHLAKPVEMKSLQKAIADLVVSEI